MSENIKPTVPYRTAIAERGKFWTVDDTYLSSLGYPTSGEGKYAILTYQVNSQPITLSGDIALGAVEIKDGVGDFKVTVFDSTNSNPLAVRQVDINGDQINSVGDNGGDILSGGETASGLWKAIHVLDTADISTLTITGVTGTSKITSLAIGVYLFGSGITTITLGTNGLVYMVK